MSSVLGSHSQCLRKPSRQCRWVYWLCIPCDLFMIKPHCSWSWGCKCLLQNDLADLMNFRTWTIHRSIIPGCLLPNLQLALWGRDKMDSSLKTTFWYAILEWKCSTFVKNVTKYCPVGSNDNNDGLFCWLNHGSFGLNELSVYHLTLHWVINQLVSLIYSAITWQRIALFCTNFPTIIACFLMFSFWRPLANSI